MNVDVGDVIKFDGKNTADVMKFCNEAVPGDESEKELEVWTKRGYIKCLPGDFIAKKNGNFIVLPNYILEHEA